MSTAGYLLIDAIFDHLSLTEQVAMYCKEYLRGYLAFTIQILLMNNFAIYMIASEKASLSLVCTIAGGVTNILLDYIFIKYFAMGICGAAIATGLGYSITAVDVYKRQDTDRVQSK